MSFRGSGTRCRPPASSLIQFLSPASGAAAYASPTAVCFVRISCALASALAITVASARAALRCPIASVPTWRRTIAAMVLSRLAAVSAAAALIAAV